jgi:23S rRNA (cytidine1920-2'-O)/16S rRNA (cytidine1409-2'-O)-methyltransferase
VTQARRHRLDDELVERGFFQTTDEALRAILAGEVSTSDRRLTSAGERVESGIELHVRGRDAFVSRGGTKLERGLEAFDVDPRGRACLDVGCSTGGFTDCLLRHGAASVLSVDVGYAQFDWALRNDPRVTLLERTNIVDVPARGGAPAIDLAVCDVSFTSVLTVLPAVLELLGPAGVFLTLVKPQFEASREDVGEGGVVRGADVRLAALERVAAAFAQAGLGPLAACESPIRGHKGNAEYLLFGRCGSPAASLDLATVVRDGTVVGAAPRGPVGMIDSVASGAWSGEGTQ